MNRQFKQGLKHGIPIAIGYFSVSFTFGIMAVAEGISPWAAALISLTNVTSAGQFAGLTLMVNGATLFEMILTQFIINLRYALMSLSLSQKLKENTGTLKRMLIAFANTDEIFAVAINYPGDVTPIYMAGLELLPIAGWTLGTLTGAIATTLLPASVQSALGVALYAMFIAIVLPPARQNRSIAIVAFIALVISSLLYYLPVFNWISSGFAIIICTVIAAGIGAFCFPIEEEEVS